MIFLQNLLQAFFTVSLPFLITITVLGILLSIIQTITQINETSFIFVIKLLAVLFLIYFLGTFVFETLKTFLLNNISTFFHGAP